MKFSMRIGDFELKSCNQYLTSLGEHTTAEIVQWSKDETTGRLYCWTIACWREDKEGFDLYFIDSRPFECDAETFFKLAKTGQIFLTEYLEKKSS